MLLFRSLTLGLLGAVLYFVVAGTSSPPLRAVSGTVQTPAPDVTIVDVAHGVEPTTVASLVRVHASERIVKVDGRRVDSSVEGGAEIATRAHGPQRYIDVEIDGASGTSRRVLVLLH